MSYPVFILTHGRPDRVYTIEALRTHGFTGSIYLVLDNLDETIDEYRKNYEDEVEDFIVFDKVLWRKYTDVMDLDPALNVVVFARNAVWEIAKQLEYRYFVVMDDDYKYFVLTFLERGKKKEVRIKDMDRVFDLFFNYMKKASKIDVLAFSQGGDYIGGGENYIQQGYRRKIMNVYFFDTMKPIKFMGRLNEDANASVYHGLRGRLFLTIAFVKLQQMMTQKNAGGLTDEYLRLGTYVKSFYTVMLYPAGVKISVLKQRNWRIHHKIDWDRTVPKIVRKG